MIEKLYCPLSPVTVFLLRLLLLLCMICSGTTTHRAVCSSDLFVLVCDLLEICAVFGSFSMVLTPLQRTDIIVEVFTGFVNLSRDEHERRLSDCVEQFQTFYKTLSDEDRVSSVKVRAPVIVAAIASCNIHDL